MIEPSERESDPAEPEAIRQQDPFHPFPLFSFLLLLQSGNFVLFSLSLSAIIIIDVVAIPEEDFFP